MKTVLERITNNSRHWVGDGFPVRSLFSYSTHAAQMTPFLLLDYAGPQAFRPASRPRGVGQHPHRGFETVTIVYSGEVAHKDSAGNGGVIGPGDVQWMTAGSGILHEEFHSPAFTATGGTLEMVQLWVNLPAQYKMTAPHYQAIADTEIPAEPLADNAGSVRVIAGRYGETNGPAQTFTPMNVWDLRLNASASTTLALPTGWTAGIVVLRGTVQINGEQIVRAAELVTLTRDGSDVVLEANNDAIVLVLSGEPIDEPIAGYGPFVMNTQAQIEQAMRDVQSGNFGRIAN
ncbi:pirin family protein [Pseudohongiella spirulinae]|uniref:Pirin-like protein n=1 Tax=Pseudohongiella spirulinae TaxID=1249552 RepID=A0A0S2KCS8_9GAMM|nr:pirin family protein [Pseudohongiella spirulinae]ALO45791.1 Pirin-like protein [Pseudohongiella spirulinae]